MREQIAEGLYILDFACRRVIAWRLATCQIREKYLKRADAILTLISEETEKVENPFGDYKLHSKEGFEQCRQKILSLLRSEK